MLFGCPFVQQIPEREKLLRMKGIAKEGALYLAIGQAIEVRPNQPHQRLYAGEIDHEDPNGKSGSREVS